MKVVKEKDLSSCTKRPDLAAYVPSTGYITDSPIQSLPIVTSKNKCTQTIEEGVLKMAECEETHKFRPFSTDEGGAVTTAKTTLLLVSHDSPASPVPGRIFTHIFMISGNIMNRLIGIMICVEIIPCNDKILEPVVFCRIPVYDEADVL